jgi:hypothetical protein
MFVMQKILSLGTVLVFWLHGILSVEFSKYYNALYLVASRCQDVTLNVLNFPDQ